MNGKRGSVFDLVTIIIVIAVLATVLLLGNVVSGSINSQLITQMNDTQVNTTLTQVTATVNSTDSFSLLILAGLIIAMFISAYAMMFDVVFAVVFFIFLVVATVVAIPISNYYSSLITDPMLSSTAGTYYPITNLIMSQLPILIFALGIITLIITYAKSSWGGANV